MTENWEWRHCRENHFLEGWQNLVDNRKRHPNHQFETTEMPCSIVPTTNHWITLNSSTSICRIYLIDFLICRADTELIGAFSVQVRSMPDYRHLTLSNDLYSRTTSSVRWSKVVTLSRSTLELLYFNFMYFLLISILCGAVLLYTYCGEFNNTIQYPYCAAFLVSRSVMYLRHLSILAFTNYEVN